MNLFAKYVFIVMCEFWELTVDITTDVRHSYESYAFFIFCFLTFVQFSAELSAITDPVIAETNVMHCSSY